jgi:hypothetical protein
MGKEIGHMNSNERIYFYKCASNNTKLCKNLKEFLISHLELSLQMNHPQWIKCLNKIPFILLINTEHDIVFFNEASWIFALDIMVAFICLIDEVKRNCK